MSGGLLSLEDNVRKVWAETLMSYGLPRRLPRLLHRQFARVYMHHLFASPASFDEQVNPSLHRGFPTVGTCMPCCRFIANKITVVRRHLKNVSSERCALCQLENQGAPPAGCNIIVTMPSLAPTLDQLRSATTFIVSIPAAITQHASKVD